MQPDKPNTDELDEQDEGKARADSNPATNSLISRYGSQSLKDAVAKSDAGQLDPTPKGSLVSQYGSQSLRDAVTKADSGNLDLNSKGSLISRYGSPGLKDIVAKSDAGQLNIDPKNSAISKYVSRPESSGFRNAIDQANRGELNLDPSNSIEARYKSRYGKKENDGANRGLKSVAPAEKNSEIPGASAIPAAMNAAQNLQQGNISGAAHQGVEAAKAVGGSWLVNFFWYSTLEIFPGALYGLPALTAYMVIGAFSKDAAWHQLAKWQMAVVIILDLVVIILLFIIIVATLYSYCNGISGLVANTTSKVGLTPSVCSAFQ